MRSRRRIEPAEFRSMWLVAMFDLPVETAEQRKEYAQFRKTLLRQGFIMLQYSVYARHAASEESLEPVRSRLGVALPPHGEVRLLAITDHQFGKMDVYVGKKRRPAETPPAQLMLF